MDMHEHEGRGEIGGFSSLHKSATLLYRAQAVELHDTDLSKGRVVGARPLQKKRSDVRGGGVGPAVRANVC